MLLASRKFDRLFTFEAVTTDNLSGLVIIDIVSGLVLK